MPAAETIAAGDQETIFPQLLPEHIRVLEAYGSEQTLAPEETLFSEGEDESDFYLVLEGRLKITKDVSGEPVVLTIHEPGHFTGALSLLSTGKSIASAHALGPTRVRRIGADDFRRLIAEKPEIASIILSAMAQRRPSADAFVMQREKLAALGTLSAGLAHELNNPAAAARRAVSELRVCLRRLQTETATLACLLSGDARQGLESFAESAGKQRVEKSGMPLSPLEQSDREEVLGAWLEEKNIPDPYTLAATLVDAGLDAEALGPVTEFAGDALGTALAWLAARLECDSLMEQTEQSVGRISDLVTAIKEYSYRDQAPRQEVDVVRSIETTRTILAHKLREKNIEFVRDYAPDLPKIMAYGGELNQVWTNLFDNAISAVAPSGGKITVSVTIEGDALLVAFTDNGTGIPPDVQPHIFEPFFTTKAPGEGTGLGLDTSYRIIAQRHNGDIRVASRPGETRFEVRLSLAGV